MDVRLSFKIWNREEAHEMLTVLSMNFPYTCQLARIFNPVRDLSPGQPDVTVDIPSISLSGLFFDA